MGTLIKRHESRLSKIKSPCSTMRRVWLSQSCRWSINLALLCAVHLGIAFCQTGVSSRSPRSRSSQQWSLLVTCKERMIIMPATIKKKMKIIKRLRFKFKKWMTNSLQRMSLRTSRMSSKDSAILIMTMFKMFKRRTYIILILDLGHSLIQVRHSMLTRSIDRMVKIRKSTLMTSTSKLHVTLLILILTQKNLLITLNKTHWPTYSQLKTNQIT